MEIDNKKLSFVTAERLKELREKRGLSHVSLSQELSEKYKNADNSKPETKKKKKRGGGEKELVISKDTLTKYEVSNEFHTNAFANGGMNIEYLRYFADFYGVSADYLIGLSDIASPDFSIKAICGLSSMPEDMVENFMKFANIPAVRFFLQELFKTPVDLMKRFSRKYIDYSVGRNAVAPSIGKNKADDMKNVLVKREIDGEEMLPIPAEKFDEYVKFELWSLFNEILRCEENADAK